MCPRPHGGRGRGSDEPVAHLWQAAEDAALTNPKAEVARDQLAEHVSLASRAVEEFEASALAPLAHALRDVEASLRQTPAMAKLIDLSDEMIRRCREVRETRTTTYRSPVPLRTQAESRGLAVRNHHRF